MPTPKPPQPAAAAPEPKKPAGPAPAQTAVQGGQVTLVQVQAQWGAIHARLKQVKAHSTEALLNSCKLQSLKDGVLLIGFASEIIKTKMEANDNIKVFRAAIQQVVGVDVQIACVVMGNKVEVDPSDLSVDGDGIVGTALNLGGKIVKKEKGQDKE
jgi:DNA polymerase-3 subunit gamma/tau